MRKVYAIVLLFCFVLVSVVKAFHTHENHNHCQNDTENYSEQNLDKHTNKSCQICAFVINIKQSQILSKTFDFDFKQYANQVLLHYDFVAFFAFKHISLFSGNSPPIA